MDKHGIAMSFHLNRIISDVRPINWPSLCNTINHFNRNGYTLDMQHRVASRIAAVVAFGKNGPSKQKAETTYDRVLFKMLHTQSFSHIELQERRIWERGDLKVRCVAERYGTEFGPKNRPGSGERYEDSDLEGACLRQMQDLDVRPQRRGQPIGIDFGSMYSLPRRPKTTAPPAIVHKVPYVEGTTKIWRARVDKEKPLWGKVALVLDTGRYDGVTTKICQEMARFGAKVALTYVDEGDNAANANEVAENIRLHGGRAIALAGMPHRSEKYSDKVNEEDIYIRELIIQTLRAFKAKQLHIIGMYPSTSVRI